MTNAELIIACARQQRLLKLMIEKSKQQSRQNLTQQLEEILAPWATDPKKHRKELALEEMQKEHRPEIIGEIAWGYHVLEFEIEMAKSGKRPSTSNANKNTQQTTNAKRQNPIAKNIGRSKKSHYQFL